MISSEVAHKRYIFITSTQRLLGKRLFFDLVSRGEIVDKNFITEDITSFIHRLMESHQVKICIGQVGYEYYRTIFATELLNSVADPQVPRSGPHKQKTTTFRHEYALECAIGSLGLFFSGGACPDSSRANNRLAVPTVVCKNYCKTSAPHRLSIPRSATGMMDK